MPGRTGGSNRRGERHWYRATAMSRDQRRALRLLAGSPLGCTEAIMLAHGFTTDLLGVHAGLATATPQTVHAGKRPIEVVRVRITDAALGRSTSPPTTTRTVIIEAANGDQASTTPTAR